MSILKTRFRRFAQVMAARRCIGVGSSAPASAHTGESRWRGFGITWERQALCGAKTPW